MNNLFKRIMAHELRKPLLVAYVLLFSLLAGLSLLAGETLPLTFRIVIEIAKLTIVLGLVWHFVQYARTQEKNSQTQYAQMRENSKFAALGEVAAGMAHEINTPLGAITLSISQLKELVPSTSENYSIAQEIIEDVLTSAEKIARIVRGLKNFSRDSTKAADFVFCDLSTVVRESLALCESSLRNQGVQLRTNDLPEGFDLQCNPAQLSQIIINLVNNARDAAATQNEKWLEVAVSAKGNQVELRVTDSGGGIAEHDREKLFKSFFTTKVVGKGTGLGLSIVQGIVKQHRGEIFLDTAHPHTSFVVRLPRIQTT